MALALLVAAACLGVPAAAEATDPAALFDAPGEHHADVCVHVASPTSPLLYGDGTPTGFDLTSDQLAYDDGSCPDGTARLDLHELIPSAGGPLAFHRGGSGYLDRENVKYGDLAAAGVTDSLPPPVPSSGGRGAPCTLASEPPYQVAVQSIPSRMRYKRPQDVPDGNTNGSSFVHYGDPAADQGSNSGAVHYTYLLWSFVDVSGGGTVRTLLQSGQVVHACDVAVITMPSWDPAGAVNGSVTARYVETLAGSCPVYGWMVWSHTYYPSGAAPVAHAAPASVAPPPDPAPDPSCPVAAPAAAPAVATGDAATGQTAATLSGTVNPIGVPTTYHFELGPTTAYGTSTPPAALSATDQSLPAGGQVGGLQPGSAYHYRLVASNTHGSTSGPDRTLVTAAPPAPDVSGLRVKPASFRRARTRRGAPAHISFRLSAPALVSIAFQRRAVGVRRGGTCRAAPARGVSRRASRCHRWIAVRGSLRQQAAAGGVSLRFGGWIGRRALASGRYRLRAVPAGAAGAAGVPRFASFTLR